MGFEPMMATELEFYLFENSYEILRDSLAGWHRDLKPISAYNEDYHIFQTTKEEDVMRAVRNGLYGAGIPVENSKGEAEAGQEEINYRYSDALDTADNHVIVKNGDQGNRLVQGPVGDLHGQVRPPPGRVVEPCPPVAVDAGRQARLPRPRRRCARHVGH
jgi:glutamine synthetase type III